MQKMYPAGSEKRMKEIFFVKKKKICLLLQCPETLKFHKVRAVTYSKYVQVAWKCCLNKALAWL